MFSTRIASVGARFSIGLLCLILWLAGSAAASGDAILVLGDSLSAGYGIGIEQSWTALLRARLAENGYVYRVENASISGETTSGGLARLPRLLKRHRPAVVVVELGANDALRGIPVTEAERNFLDMCRLITVAGARTLLLEMRVPPNYGPAYTEQFDRLYGRLGELDNVRLVPFFLHDVVLDRSLMQNDGLHPNARAQSKMLENVWVYLEDELR
ncbi:MAG TPA: arylesterase [Gammaproteobacteria bacterium]|jgi:acyl-CoA thioesterase-1|nr:arylesterase [Gammaproteobacteria bacterium]